MIEQYMLESKARIEGVSKRLEDKTRFNKDTGCIEWVAKAKANGGYGTLCIGRRGQIRAHRAAWVLKNGPIPRGLYVCHTCDNPACCNVEHLFLGTPKQNMDDKMSKGRGTMPPIISGEKHHNATISADGVSEIRASTKTLRVLAMDYNVSEKTIWRIKKGLTRNEG